MSEQVMVELRLIEQTFRLATTSDKKMNLNALHNFSMRNLMTCAVVPHVLSTTN